MILVRVLACGKSEGDEMRIHRLISCFIAILVNIRDAVQVAEFWDEGQDGASELNKLILPVLVASLNYDIQEAATKTTAAVTSGVSVYKSNRMTTES